MRDDVYVAISPDKSPQYERKEAKLTWACSDPSSILPAALPGVFAGACPSVLVVVIVVICLFVLFCFSFEERTGDSLRFVSRGRHRAGSFVLSGRMYFFAVASAWTHLGHQAEAQTEGTATEAQQVLEARKMTNEPGVRKRTWAVVLVGVRGLRHREAEVL